MHGFAEDAEGSMADWSVWMITSVGVCGWSPVNYEVPWQISLIRVCLWNVLINVVGLKRHPEWEWSVRGWAEFWELAPVLTSRGTSVNVRQGLIHNIKITKATVTRPNEKVSTWKFVRGQGVGQQKQCSAKSGYNMAAVSMCHTSQHKLDDQH